MRISDWSSDVCSSDLNEFLGQVHFWVFFIGVNVLFFPMHFLGMSGMPRRIPDYTGAYAYWNQIASLGYVIMAAGLVIFFINLFWSLMAGQKAEANTWRSKARGEGKEEEMTCKS